MRCQPGVALLSARSGAPIMPWAYATRRAKALRSWDRFLVPMPFDRGAMVFGDPIAPPTAEGPEALEAHRLRIEAALLDCARVADAAVGRAPVEPAMRPALPGGTMADWPPAPGAGTQPCGHVLQQDRGERSKDQRPNERESKIRARQRAGRDRAGADEGGGNERARSYTELHCGSPAPVIPRLVVR